MPAHSAGLHLAKLHDWRHHRRKATGGPVAELPPMPQACRGGASGTSARNEPEKHKEPLVVLIAPTSSSYGRGGAQHTGPQR